MLHAAIAQEQVAGAGPVAEGRIPLGVLAKVGGSGRGVADRVIRLPAELEAGQAPVGGEDVEGFGFVGITAEDIADVVGVEGDKVFRRLASVVAGADEDLWCDEFVGGKLELEGDGGVARAVGLAAVLRLINAPRILGVVVVGPQAYGEADLLEVASRT